MPFEAPLASGHLPGDFDVDLNTTPSFITKPTFFSSLTSARGSPATAITSAYAQGATTPRSPLRPSNSATREVDDRIACIGVIPNSISRGNSCVWDSVPAVPSAAVQTGNLLSAGDG